MREIVDVRFRERLANPGGWVVFSVLGGLFVLLAGGAVVAAIVSDEGLFARLGMLAMGAAWAALGGFMLCSVVLGVSDHRSCRVQILDVTLLVANPIKTGLSLHYHDARGRRGYALVPAHWRPARLPQRAELWRTARGRESLVLALHDEGRVCSVLEGPRGSEVGLRMPLGGSGP